MSLITFQAYFHLSPLLKHVRKVVCGFGKESCVSTLERKPGKHMCFTNHHGMTFAVKVTLNPNTNKQTTCQNIKLCLKRKGYGAKPHCILHFIFHFNELLNSKKLKFLQLLFIHTLPPTGLFSHPETNLCRNVIANSEIPNQLQQNCSFSLTTTLLKISVTN